MNIKRFNGNDFPGDKWVRDILSRVNEIIDYLKRKVGFDRLSDEVTEVLTPLTSVGTDGQVLTSDGTSAGWEAIPTTPTATSSVSGIVVLSHSNGDAGKVPSYKEGTWSPATVSLSNLTGTASFTDARYTIIGRKVFVTLHRITGLSTTSASARTVLSISISGLPSIVNSTIFYGSAMIRTGGSNLEVTSPVIDESGSTSNIALVWVSPANGGTTIESLHFSYDI